MSPTMARAHDADHHASAGARDHTACDAPEGDVRRGKRPPRATSANGPLARRSCHRSAGPPPSGRAGSSERTPRGGPAMGGNRDHPSLSGGPPRAIRRDEGVQGPHPARGHWAWKGTRSVLHVLPDGEGLRSRRGPQSLVGEVPRLPRAPRPAHAQPSRAGPRVERAREDFSISFAQKLGGLSWGLLVGHGRARGEPHGLRDASPLSAFRPSAFLERLGATRQPSGPPRVRHAATAATFASCAPGSSATALGLERAAGVEQGRRQATTSSAAAPDRTVASGLLVEASARNGQRHRRFRASSLLRAAPAWVSTAAKAAIAR